MEDLEILTYPDPRLSQKCAPVEKVDEAIRHTMNQMAEMLFKVPASGYAAPQFGIMKRIIVAYDQYGKDSGRLFKMANPEIIWTSEETNLIAEGCMSIPWGRIELERPAQVRVRYLDENNQTQETEIETDYIARVFQHEIDHLDGILSIDHLSKFKRNYYIKKFKKREKEGKSFDD